MAVNPVPAGYQSLIPFLLVEDVPKQMEFLKQAFDATEICVTRVPDGTIANAEMRIGDSVIMLSPAGAQFPAMPASFYLYVADTDAMYQQAIAAGGESLMEPADMFYGDRNAGVKDAAGNLWWIATRQENLSSEEIDRRAAAQHRLS